nr:Maf family protein [Niabella hibiscisoli]
MAADTVVVLNEKIIGKPAGKQEAIDTLTQLQGTTHEVITGVAMLKGAKQVLFADVTEVVFNPLTTEQILFMWRSISLTIKRVPTPSRNG